MVDITVADLTNTLRALKNEQDHIIARGNPDRMEDFLKGSLRTFHEDMIYAKRGGYLNNEQIELFQTEYCSIADNVQDAKREQLVFFS